MYLRYCIIYLSKFVVRILFAFIFGVAVIPTIVFGIISICALLIWESASQ
jgi:hypothetical protein